MSVCKVCQKQHSKYVMNNKPVCLHCDELLFDMEIECEEYELPQTADRRQPAKEPTAPSLKRGKTTTK